MVSSDLDEIITRISIKQANNINNDDVERMRKRKRKDVRRQSKSLCVPSNITTRTTNGANVQLINWRRKLIWCSATRFISSIRTISITRSSWWWILGSIYIKFKGRVISREIEIEADNLWPYRRRMEDDQCCVREMIADVINLSIINNRARKLKYSRMISPRSPSLNIDRAAV